MAPRLLASLIVASVASLASGSQCVNGPCAPGNDHCGPPFSPAPRFHLIDQHGCGENDPNGPVFDPVHGVFHHFYQIHLATGEGHGPDYGHFVSKDLVSWAQLPVAIWNGLDASVTPAKETPYDNEAIFTGSALVLDGAGPDGVGRGVVQIYPGLCNKRDWPACTTGTLLAQAVPAAYASDPLLTNWSKPDYNPVVEGTQRDPSTPWRTPSGEWRMRTYDSSVYGAASDADVLRGKWYEIGRNPSSFRTCECPSFYPLPGPTPGTERAHAEALGRGALPNHVEKTSCAGGDWWQLGTYVAGAPRQLGSFNATPGWEDVFAPRRIDQGSYYASKDTLYPSRPGADGDPPPPRRVNWGWATIPLGAQSLPRVVTFNAAARLLEQAPLDELSLLRGPAAYSAAGLQLDPAAPFAPPLRRGTVQFSEADIVFTLPTAPAVFGADVGGASCVVRYAPPPNASAPFYEVGVECGGAGMVGATADTLRLLPAERELRLRLYCDATILEAYFQGGRVAMTRSEPFDEASALSLRSSVPLGVGVDVYPMRSIWTDAEAVRKAPRIYYDGASDRSTGSSDVEADLSTGALARNFS